MKNTRIYTYIGIVFLLLPQHVLFAQKVICKQGTISLFSETPMENISAENHKVVSVLDLGTRQVAVKMTITDFVFPNKLMQEHFNENYMESEKHPTAWFTGKLSGISDFEKNGKQAVFGEGELMIHGVKRKVKLNGQLEVSEKALVLQANFTVKPEDYGIEIPSLVITKIAEEIKVSAAFSYTKNAL
ncbi:YceI family protein [Marinilongibacter aquaticus]|uniref:YceI family protein n=1 Tax=Marinilongibacter aquaticus TaxID=2975157 RepID=UPI0021BD62B5|nr:YceI family protein [Marinilongibacter aquaticus]UBM59180.1 YceI family protein [Marinilongibacter aquaticus]